MSGNKFCRLCLNEVDIRSSDFQTRDILVNIFPGMNTYLTNSVRLCENCFNNINFANRVKNGVTLKESEFLRKNIQEANHKGYCKMCFQPQTESTIFFIKKNFPGHMLKAMIEIVLSENKFNDNNTIICPKCWPWVKKIYGFKKQCFQMEQRLELYRNRKNLSSMQDTDLEEFLQDQYCIRIGQWLPNREHKAELTEHAKHSIILRHQEYFRATGEVYPNLNENNSIEAFENAEENVKDIMFGGCEIDIVENKLEVYQDVPCEAEACHVIMDADDEFDEEIERSNKTDDVINLEDDNEDVCEVLVDYTSDVTEEIDNMESSDSNNVNNPQYDVDYTSDVTEEIGLESSDSNNVNNSPQYNTLEYYSTYDKPSSPKNVDCCEPSPQYDNLFNPFEPSCQVIEDDGPSQPQIVTNIYNINIVPAPAPNKGIITTDCHVVLHRNAHLDDFGKVGNDQILNKDLEIEKSAEEDMIIIDDDECNEFVKKENNIIDLTNVEDYFNQTQPTTQQFRSPDLKNGEVWGCYVCVAKFFGKESARRHLLNHEDLKNKYGRFQCSHCPFKANWKGSVTKHNYYHTQESRYRFGGKRQKYMCPYCDTPYSLKPDIESHMAEHVISWKRFQCIDCMFNTNFSEALRSHYKNYHCQGRDPNFVATIHLAGPYYS